MAPERVTIPPEVHRIGARRKSPGRAGTPQRTEGYLEIQLWRIPDTRLVNSRVQAAWRRPSGLLEGVTLAEAANPATPYRYSTIAPLAGLLGTWRGTRPGALRHRS